MKPFEEYQLEVRTKESIDQLRDELRADLHLLVQEEVRRAGVAEEVLRDWVREWVRDETARSRTPADGRAKGVSASWKSLIVRPVRLFPSAGAGGGRSSAWLDLGSTRHSLPVVFSVAILTYFLGMASGFWLSRPPVPEQLPPVLAEQPAPPLVPPDSSGVSP